MDNVALYLYPDHIAVYMGMRVEEGIAYTTKATNILSMRPDDPGYPPLHALINLMGESSPRYQASHRLILSAEEYIAAIGGDDA